MSQEVNYHPFYNQIGNGSRDFAKARADWYAEKFAYKAISAYSLQPVEEFPDDRHIYLKHSDKSYPPIRFDRRQLAILPISPEVRIQVIDWFCKSLSAGKRLPIPGNSQEATSSTVTAKRKHEDFCRQLEAKYCPSQVLVKKPRKKGIFPDSDDDEPISKVANETIVVESGSEDEPESGSEDEPESGSEDEPESGSEEETE